MNCRRDLLVSMLSVRLTQARACPSPYGKPESIDIKVLRTFSPCAGCASIDIKVLTDLKPRFFCASSL